MENEFYTLKGYQINEKKNDRRLTTAMEDYLEMVARLSASGRVVRINELAENLHVKPSSASKMVNSLREFGYVDFEKYSYITLSDEGKKEGEYLLLRHDVLNRFLCMINHSDSELEQVEKIEHFINRKTVHNIEKLICNPLFANID